MEITTNIGCKVACSYCPQNKLLDAYKKRSNIFMMSFDTFKRCIDKIPVEVDIHFTGLSEPWLNSECTKMLLYAYEKGHAIAVSTILVGMDVSDIDLLESVQFKFFYVHLPSIEGYEKIKIDEKYLEVLYKLSRSKIKVCYHVREKAEHPDIKLVLKNTKQIDHLRIMTRAGNVKIKMKPMPFRKKGMIKCERNLRENILLPNGDVILCCMDYGMKHILGNLMSSDHSSLFHSGEFLKIEKGLNDESFDILCRYCDMFALDNSMFARIYNLYWCNLISIRSFRDFYELIGKCFFNIKTF